MICIISTVTFYQSYSLNSAYIYTYEFTSAAVLSWGIDSELKTVLSMFNSRSNDDDDDGNHDDDDEGMLMKMIMVIMMMMM